MEEVGHHRHNSQINGPDKWARQGDYNNPNKRPHPNKRPGAFILGGVYSALYGSHDLALCNVTLNGFPAAGVRHQLLLSYEACL